MFLPLHGGRAHQVTRSHSDASGYESSTIDKMCMVFSTHGLPQTLMTDNGSVFTSVDFADFVQGNIRHFTSSPHHPATNSLVEWAVQTFKGAIKKAGTTVHSVEMVVSRFLSSYWVKPHTTMGIAPAELFMVRSPKTPLDLLRPDVGQCSLAQRKTELRRVTM